MNSGAHDGVAELSAESDGIGEVVGLVAADHAHADEHDDESEEEGDSSALAGVGKIETDVGRGAFGFETLAARIESSKDGKREAEHQESGRDHVGKNADIGTGVGRSEVDEKQKQDVAESHDSQRKADDRDRIANQTSNAREASERRRGE